MKVKLNDRLQAAADLVLVGQVCADIGTDHNHLPTYLVQNDICPKVIASDKAERPYQNASQFVDDFDLKKKIDLRQGWGLQVLNPAEVQTIVMTGLGGNLIADILEDGSKVLETTHRLVLQPQKKPDVVRRWLAANNWQIVEERIVLDNELFYVIMAAERGKMVLSEDEADFGPYNLKNPSGFFIDYLRIEEEIAGSLIDELKNHNTKQVKSRLKQIQSRRDRIKKILATLI